VKGYLSKKISGMRKKIKRPKGQNRNEKLVEGEKKAKNIHYPVNKRNKEEVKQRKPSERGVVFW